VREKLSDPFNAWHCACAALRLAEACGDTGSELIRLSEEVVRARNALIRDRMRAGWQPSEEVLADLYRDELLLVQTSI
jgi:hypothetical protein